MERVAQFAYSSFRSISRRMAANMKTLAAFAIICFLLAIAHVADARRQPERQHRRRGRNYNKLFVFGDSLADNGNLQRSRLSVSSRGWYYPYGSSDAAHGNRATGRFSDGLVQSDYLAKLLGRDESPRPYSVQGPNHADPFGVNFAVAGSGASSETRVPRLGVQIDVFSNLVTRGIIDEEDLEDSSVALIAISGNIDYASISHTSSFSDIVTASADVTDRIVDGVKRLQELGVSKVLVDTLPPIGCSPWQSLRTNYSSCESFGNNIASIHNNNLREKLGRSENVLLLDLYNSFLDLVQSSTPVAGQFRHKYTPCCDAFARNGYCGQEDAAGRQQYKLCPTPEHYFFWDFEHPTQAGWKAVMDLLEEPIQDFLGISD